jgi:hypothetical protein
MLQAGHLSLDQQLQEVRLLLPSLAAASQWQQQQQGASQQRPQQANQTLDSH